MSTLESETRLAVLALEGRSRENAGHRSSGHRGVLSAVLALTSLVMAVIATAHV